MSEPAPTPPWVLEMYASARRAKARAADADAAAPPVTQPLPPADNPLPRAARPAAGEAAPEADGIPPVDELQALVARGVRLAPSWAAKLVAAVPAATPSTAIPAHAAALGAYRPSRGWVAGVPAAGHSRFVPFREWAAVNGSPEQRARAETPRSEASLGFSRRRQAPAARAWSRPLRAMHAYFERTLPALPPLVVPMAKSRERPVLVYSDASFHRSRGRRIPASARFVRMELPPLEVFADLLEF